MWGQRSARGRMCDDAVKLSFNAADHARFQYYQSIGRLGSTLEPHADLGELVAGMKPGRQGEKERALAINLGLAKDDMAVAPGIFQCAKDKGLGMWLPL